MAAVAIGDTVRVHYTGRFDDGTEFDSSVGGEPLEFKIGEGLIIAGFEEAVIGMKPGDSKQAVIPWEKAYGPHRTELMLEVDRKEFSSHLEPVLGQRLEVSGGTAGTLVVVVTDVTDSVVKLDANHPLAGKRLEFDIQLLDIR